MLTGEKRFSIIVSTDKETEMKNLTNEQISKTYTTTVTMVVPLEDIVGNVQGTYTNNQYQEAAKLKDLGLEAVNTQLVVLKVVSIDAYGNWKYEVITHGEQVKLANDLEVEYLNVLVVTPKDVEVVEELEAEEIEELKELEEVVEIYKGANNKGFKTERGAKSARTRLMKKDGYQGSTVEIVKLEGVYALEIKK